MNSGDQFLIGYHPNVVEVGRKEEQRKLVARQGAKCYRGRYFLHPFRDPEGVARVVQSKRSWGRSAGLEQLLDPREMLLNYWPDCPSVFLWSGSKLSPNAGVRPVIRLSRH